MAHCNSKEIFLIFAEVGKGEVGWSFKSLHIKIHNGHEETLLDPFFSQGGDYILINVARS